MPISQNTFKRQSLFEGVYFDRYHMRRHYNPLLPHFFSQIEDFPCLVKKLYVILTSTVGTIEIVIRGGPLI